jgi:hypothetical protein
MIPVHIPPPTSLRSTFKPSTHLCLGLPGGLFPSSFNLINSYVSCSWVVTEMWFKYQEEGAKCIRTLTNMQKTINLLHYNSAIVTISGIIKCMVLIYNLCLVSKQVWWMHTFCTARHFHFFFRGCNMIHLVPFFPVFRDCSKKWKSHGAMSGE